MTELLSAASGIAKVWAAWRSGLSPAKGFEAMRALLADDPAAALASDALALKACFREARGQVAAVYQDILREAHSQAFRESVSVALANLPDLAAALPDAPTMMGLGYTPESYAQALADRAVARGMEVFRDGEARTLLTRCMLAMFAALDRDTAFVAAVERIKWAEAYGRLASIKEDTAATRAGVAAGNRKLDAQDSKLDEILAAVSALSKEPQAHWERMAKDAQARLGATEAVVANFFSTMLDRRVEPDQFEATFTQIENDFRILREGLERPSRFANLTPELNDLRGEAEAALNEGEIDVADRILAEIYRREQEENERSARRIAGLRRDIEEEERHLTALADGKVPTLRLRIQSALLTLRHAEAAQLMFEEITLTEPPEKRFETLLAVWDAYHVRGHDKGLNVDLERAIELARIACREASTPDERGMALNDLAVSLSIIGERESGTQRLSEAIAACRAALEERTRERVPLDWAMTQNNLGNALQTLSEREGSNARLEQAVAAYRAALEEGTRERVPLNWATTQNNLGNALRALGEREGSNERLEQALTAYRAALEERTRERVPLDWAMTQNNLGNVLQTLSERQGSNERLEKAVAAYRAALEEGTRERVPLDWAMTQNNLGHALQTLGEREGSNERLEQAVAAYRAALEERTRERVPLDWAMTQNNLGNALQTLGEREGSNEPLEQAVAAYRAALEERTRERVPLDWAMTQNNLGAALQILGEREGANERLEQAVAAFRDALEEWTHERVPLAWAAAQDNLGNALRALGEREGSSERLEQAVVACRAALEERTRERVPLGWAMPQNNLGVVLQALGAREGSNERLEQAVAAYRAALEVFTPEAAPRYHAIVTQNLARAQALLDSRRDPPRSR
jgi:tetratricopeptide (TPR) repeat protein